MSLMKYCLLNYSKISISIKKNNIFMKNIFMKKFFFIIVILLFCATANSQTPLTTAVDFTATDVHGQSHNLFSYLNAGKYVLIDFFFTTCGPCISAAPQVNASYEHFGCNTGGAIFLGIDDGDSDAQVLAFDNSNGVHYPTISGNSGGTAICNTYQITAFPTIILIAPNKNIVVQDMWPFSTSICNNEISSHGVNSAPCTNGFSDYEKNIITGVYPNPASDIAQFTFMGEQNTKYNFTIYDLSGKPVMSETMNMINASGEYSYSIQVNNLASGSYILVLSSDNKPCGRVPLMIVR
jgi:thiol-disulfide isomerase/thioredoxin